MRSGQQNKRGRGRNNNNNNNSGRKSGNPLSRTYDSTGPDVKIRGTAQHIADKYSTMARDSLGSGDTVMAENYFQHAEHYNRIIATAQAQMQERYQREERDAASREQPAVEQNETVAAPGERDAAEVVVDGSGPQPVISGTPAEMVIEEENAQQPARRQPVRRRAPARPRRPRTSAAEGASEPAVADAGDSDAPAPADTRSSTGEAQDTKPEVVAAAPDA
jgi:hypothetical protein